MRRTLLATTTALLLLLTTGGVLAQDEASGPGDGPTPEQLAEAEERLATATCLGKVATIVAIAGFETTGTEGADVIVGTAADDVISGGGGNDTICAGPGADTVTGGAGGDVIDGGKGDDKLDGGAGNDRLKGAAGDDVLDGGRGNDTCTGGPGTDWLPGCNDRKETRGTLIVRGNTTLKGPHRGSIIIAADKVTLDCDGHSVRGRGAGVGILLEDRDRVSVRNCEVIRFSAGIALVRADRNRVEGNRPHGNANQGIAVWDSDRNRVRSNVVNDNGFGRHATFGIQIEGTSAGNILVGNSANRNGETNIGIEGLRTRGNTVRRNTTSGGARGFTARGSRHIFEGNVAIGIGEHGLESEASNSTFRDNRIEGSGTTGFRIGGTRNTVVGNSSDANGWVGFEDYSVPGVNEYVANTCVGNDHAGSAPAGLCEERPPTRDVLSPPTVSADVEAAFPSASEIGEALGLEVSAMGISPDMGQYWEGAEIEPGALVSTQLQYYRGPVGGTSEGSNEAFAGVGVEIDEFRSAEDAARYGDALASSVTDPLSGFQTELPADAIAAGSWTSADGFGGSTIVARSGSFVVIVTAAATGSTEMETTTAAVTGQVLERLPKP